MPATQASTVAAASVPAERAPLGPEGLAALRRQLFGHSQADNLDVPLQSLIPVDLRDEVAVKARLQAIERRLRSPVTSTASTSSAALARDSLIEREFQALLAERAILRMPRSARVQQLEADLARQALAREKAEATARVRAAEAAVKEAEAARFKALQEAERAKTEAIKALKSRLALVAQSTSQLADRSQRSAEYERTQNASNGEALARAQELLQRETTVSDGPAAYALFGELRAELTVATDALRQALKKPTADIPEPDLRANLKLSARGASQEERVASEELRQAILQYDAYRAEVRQHERDYRTQAISVAYRRVQALAAARVRLLKKLPETAQAELEGISPQGLEEARLEADLLALGARAQPVLHAGKVQQVPSHLKDALTLGKSFWVLTKVLFVVLLALWLRRKGGALAVWADRIARQQFRSMHWLRRYAFIKRNVVAYGPYLLFLLTIHLVYWSLGSWGQNTEVDLLFTTILWVSYYWLLRTWLDATIRWLAKKRHISLSPESQDKLRRSTTLVARTVLTFGLLQSVAVRILRRGILFHFADLLLLAGAAVVVLVLVRRWRRSIASAYLNKWPQGTLAELVQSTQDKFYNIFVVIAALGYVLMSGAMAFGHQFILGFEQSRKALAFVFRKRLERRSEKMGAWGSGVEQLPAPLKTAFSLEPLTNSALRMEYFPGVDKLLRDVERWKNQQSKGSFVLIGSAGYGKSTWLHRALASVSTDSKYLVIERQDARPASLLGQLGEALELGAQASYEDVVQSLRRGPQMVWALDDVHHLFFRTMQGCEALDTLMALIEDTGDKVFWLCAFDRHAWRHILSHRPTRIRFRAEQVLANWPEDKLRQLLMMRAGASGVSHEFEDLVVAGEADKEAALQEASEGYTRLIWDYSDGCPRVALRFWLHSLVPTGPHRVRVRLFREPDESVLSNMPEESIFIYAAVANHGALSASETAQIVGFPERLCEAALVRGVEEGYLSEQAHHRFKLAVDWQRQMTRFLRARQAL